MALDGQPKDKTCDEETLYGQAIVCGHVVAVGSSVVVETVNFMMFTLYILWSTFENSGENSPLQTGVVMISDNFWRQF